MRLYNNRIGEKKTENEHDEDSEGGSSNHDSHGNNNTGSELEFKFLTPIQRGKISAKKSARNAWFQNE